ncbi:hypothetical protein F511_36560 [Dorcoceras hygrometricum]|uniref:Uncharacterized protein n=1 Tax=Dorcoceras hygrometricum TaxID=472368 RepID=A0A2Z7A5I7_9LAMI|nr:hypothetical protein F511_36560 [Dorcoceras hygrometricum]
MVVGPRLAGLITTTYYPNPRPKCSAAPSSKASRRRRRFPRATAGRRRPPPRDRTCFDCRAEVILSVENPSSLLVQIDGGRLIPVVDLIGGSTAAYREEPDFPCEFLVGARRLDASKDMAPSAPRTRAAAALRMKQIALDNQSRTIRRLRVQLATERRGPETIIRRAAAAARLMRGGGGALKIGLGFQLSCC